VLLLPEAFDGELSMNANMPFLRELVAGRVPDWLAPRYTSASALLYDVVHEELQDAHATN
jgi:hypothetical protein